MDDKRPRQMTDFWALKEGEDYAAEVRLKVKRYFEVSEQLGLLEQYRAKYRRYFMQVGKQGFAARADSTVLDFGTRKKPEVNIQVAELRAALRQQLAFLLAEPISFQVVSRTGQQRSVMGSEVGEKVSNYAYGEYIKPTQVDFAENFIVYGCGASHIRWDARKGDDVIETHQVPLTDPQTGEEIPEFSKDDNGNPRVDPNTQQPIPLTDEQGQVVPRLIEQQRPGKSGAPYRDALDPTMIAYDPMMGSKANWGVAFERSNLYVLAKKFENYTNPRTGQPMPELPEQILAASCNDEYTQWRLNVWQDLQFGGDDGDIIIMHVYYADTEEIAKGRYDIIIDRVVVPMGECPLPAGRLPIRVALNSKYTDNALSFADSSIIMPVEESLNKLRSSELTNYAYYGQQTRWQETGSKVISGEGTSGGQRVIEGPRGAAPPQMLNINAMPGGAKDLREDLLDAVPRLTGYSDVSRGNIDDTTSGTHAAVFEAITARNLSLPQAQIIEHETAIMNDTLEMMQRFGNVEFIAEIAGKSGAPLARAFAPDDLSSIRRLVAKPVPDAMRGPLARIKVVELTKDIQDPRERAKAVQMITRGDDEYGRNDSRQLNLIAIENEWLLSGEFEAVVSELDNHYDHNVDHFAAFCEYRTQPDADPQVIMRFQEHIAGHAKALENQDPVYCQTVGMPAPPMLPGNNAFIFASRMQEAQNALQAMMPAPMPGPGVPGEPDADDQQEQAPPPAAEGSES